ncbi:MAG: cobaltochelatase subunit CobN [Chromatiales bacterium]|jgi:cobaltochelatase CobN
MNKRMLQLLTMLAAAVLAGASLAAGQNYYYATPGWGAPAFSPAYQPMYPPTPPGYQSFNRSEVPSAVVAPTGNAGKPVPTQTIAEPLPEIGQGAGKIMMLTMGHGNPARTHLLTTLAAEQGLQLQHVDMKSHDKQTTLADIVDGYQLLLLDSVSAKQTEKNFADLVPQIWQLQLPVKIMALRWPEGEAMRKHIDLAQAQEIQRYYVNGGRENFNRMLSYMRAELMQDRSVTEVAPPIIYPAQGVYHPDYPDSIANTPDEYLQWYSAQKLGGEQHPVVGIVIHRDNLVSENTAVTDDMIHRVEANGAIPLAFYYHSGRDAGKLADWLVSDGKPVIQTLINTRVIHWAEEQRKLFEQLGVTVINAINYSGPEEKWRNDNGGVPAMSIPFYLTLPEIAGVADPKVVAARNEADGRFYSIDEQIDLVVRKAVRLANLASKPNRDKKVAILYYNYPPGERNAGASFLNVPRSVEHITQRMKQAGYHNEVLAEQTMIDAVATLQRPYYREEAPATVVDKGLAGTLPLSEYRQWYSGLPETVRRDIEQEWGQPEDHYLVADINGEQQFVIPLMRSGNLLVLPQPPRGDKNQYEKKIYHSKSLPINHYYLAAYLYLRKHFKADALVHLGTHGSHEWMPGKERGPWAYDPSSLTADDVPVVYPYIVDDVGEAMQAKRRGHAVMISHMTPPFAPSGLYREISEIHELTHNYLSVDPGLVRERTRKQLIEKVASMNIPADIGWQVVDVEARFDDFLRELHDYLHELMLENQPLGMHTWGKPAEDRLLTSTVMQILGTDYADAMITYVNQQSGRSAEDGEEQEHGQPGLEDLVEDYVKLEALPGYRLLYASIIENKPAPDDASDNLRQLLVRGKDLLQLMRGTLEMDSFLAALDGRYIEPSTGGDPIRNDESLPSGRNLYGFDPSRLPTKAAWETGKQLTADLINDYSAKHGRYPEKMAFSLWSIEAMRHHGVLESQALYAMGLRPVWEESGRVSGVEVIPYSELKRPRVDVVLSATGLYRDAFPGVMKLLADGVDRIARLKEESNFVYRNSQRLQQQLAEAGVSPEDADYLSTVRIFSSETGNYGTGLEAGVMASDTWEKDDKLANLYLSRMGYAFGVDEDRWSEHHDNLNLYAKNLSGTDVAAFSRSSNLYGLLTSDDPFQNLGGISLAVRNIDGKSPEMFISNLRNPQQQKMETLNTFMSKELRTRQFHPRWIGEMQAEGYSGTLEILDSVNNFWGWQVVDPQNIRADQWQEFFEVYVNDKYDMAMREWFEQNNPEALAQISERMLEAIRKGYWQADAAIVEKLVETYQEIAVRHDVQSINQKFNDYVADQAQGFGLQQVAVTPMELPPVNIPQPPSQPQQQVQGQKLEKVEAEAQPIDNDTLTLLLLLIALTILSGAIWQQWRDEVMARVRPVFG